MSYKWILIGIAAVLLIAVGFSSMYTVAEHEQAIITRFGEIQGKAKTRSGLHFKLPFVDEVHTIDKRWLEWDGDKNQVPTGDKKYIWVDTYARWRIDDPVTFYERLGDERSAQSRLDDIIDGEIRNVIANNELLELARTSSREFELGMIAEASDVDPAEFHIQKGRDALRKIVLEKASEVAPDYGIELGDVRFKRINYVESVQKKVFDRMISERKRIAERYRSEGKGKAAEISGKVDKELRQIESEAYEESQEIRGKADANAAKIYAEAYETDPDLYEFTKTLETYELTIDKETTLVLSTDSELMGYLKRAEGR